MTIRHIAASILFATLLLLVRVPGQAADFPGFRGHNRDNISTETRLLKSWPAAGPKLLWTARSLGEGYSTVSIVGDRAYTMGATQAGGESVHAIDLAGGNIIWSTKISSQYSASAGNGPRATPTIDGNRIYAQGLSGDVACLDLENGRIVWQKNVLKEFGGGRPGWAICESLMIDGQKMICTPGGQNATMVALDKVTGDELWRSAVPGNPGAAYSSPVVTTVGGVRQYVNFTRNAVIGVRANDGKFLWKQSGSVNGTANCSSPLAAAGLVFTASGYGKGGALVQLTSSQGTTAAKQIYHTRNMKNHHGGMVLLKGFVYGFNDGGGLTCLALKTGQVAWRNRSVGKGAVTYADGHIYLRSEGGKVALVQATHSAYRQTGVFAQPQRSRRPAWAHPVVADGKLFLRDQDILLAFDIKGR
jgi:outer membrane protein assembly factor BamB